MATAAQLEALADASQRADELVHKKINDAQDDVGTRVDLLAEPDLSLAAADVLRSIFCSQTSVWRAVEFAKTILVLRPPIAWESIAL